MKHIITFLAFLGCSTLTTAKPAKFRETIPFSSQHSFVRRDDGTFDYDAYVLSIFDTMAKYNDDPDPPYNSQGQKKWRKVRRADDDPSPGKAGVALNNLVTDTGDSPGIPFGYVTIGSQSKDLFPVTFDTGTPLSSFPGKHCDEPQGCKGSIKYLEQGVQKVGGAQTRKRGQVLQGNYFTDNVGLGGIVAKDTLIISIHKAQNMWRISSIPPGPQNVGILGLGLSPKSIDKASVFETLVAQNALQAPEMSFFIGRGGSSITTGGYLQSTPSSITLGGRNTEKFFGDLVTVPSNPAAWYVGVSGVFSNNDYVGPTASMPAFIDTASPHIFMTEAAASAIMGHIPDVIAMAYSKPPPEYSDTTDIPVLYAFPCRNTPHISFVMNDKAFVVNPLDMRVSQLGPDGRPANQGATMLPAPVISVRAQEILRDPARKTDPYCLSPVVATTKPGQADRYILGTPFLRNWYTVFSKATDPPTVSFASAKDNNLNLPVGTKPDGLFQPGPSSAGVDEGTVSEGPGESVD